MFLMCFMLFDFGMFNVNMVNLVMCFIIFNSTSFFKCLIVSVFDLFDVFNVLYIF